MIYDLKLNALCMRKDLLLKPVDNQSVELYKLCHREPLYISGNGTKVPFSTLRHTHFFHSY